MSDKGYILHCRMNTGTCTVASTECIIMVDHQSSTQAVRMANRPVLYEYSFVGQFWV